MFYDKRSVDIFLKGFFEKKTMSKNPEEFTSALSRFVYVDKPTPIVLPTFDFENRKIIPLKFFQRSIGILEGTLQKFDPETQKGVLKIQGSTWEFQNTSPYRAKKNLQDHLGSSKIFSFWPTLEEIPKGRQKKISFLKISNICYKPLATLNYVETVGKLEKVWPKQFLVILYSLTAQKFYYVIFSGKYPRPEDVGKFIWVQGQFQPKTQEIEFEDTYPLEFVSEEKTKTFLEVEGLLNEQLCYSVYSPNSNSSALIEPRPDQEEVKIPIKQIVLPPPSRYKLNPQKMDKLRRQFEEQKNFPKPILVRDPMCQD